LANKFFTKDTLVDAYGEMSLYTDPSKKGKEIKWR
jgi:hypothetical protein